MDLLEVEIKEEPIFEEIEADSSFEIKDEEPEGEEEETIKIEIYPEPKYEVVEEELVNYDLLAPSVFTIISDANDQVSVVPVPQQSNDVPRKWKPKQKGKTRVKSCPKRMVHCQICKAKFFSSHTLILHEKTHNENTAFTCDKCEEVFPSLGLLMEHQKEKKHFKATDTFQEKVRALNKRKYKCKACGLIFYSEKTFRFHVKIHAGLMKYSCDVCEEMFNTLSDLAFHRERLGHGMKCQECGTICGTVQEMDQHNKMHTKWKFYKCTDCNFSTVIQKHLRQHRATSCPRLGKETSPVLCSFCNTLFQNKDIYEKHACLGTDSVRCKEPIVTEEIIITTIDNESDIQVDDEDINEDL